MPTKRQLMEDPNSCWNQCPDDAPVMVLIPTDVLMPLACRWWASQLMSMSHSLASTNKAHGALQIASEAEAWAAIYGAGIPGSGWNKRQDSRDPGTDTQDTSINTDVG